MSDFVLNISEDSEAEAVPLLSTNFQASSAVASSPSSTIATSEATAPSRPPKAYRWYLHDSDDESSLTERSLALDDEYHEPVKIRASQRLTKWNIVLPSDREKREFYDIVLGVSTRSLDMDAIESILIRFEQEKANNEGFECEVFKRRELERMSVTDELHTGADKDTDRDNDNAKEMPGQEFEKGVTEFKWKLFTQCYGFGDRVSITMEINTWPELPLDFGSLDLHFVELCTDSTALYKAVIKTLVDEDEFLEVWDLQNHDIAGREAKDPKDVSGVLDSDDSNGAKDVMMKPHRATPVAWMPLVSGGITDVSISWD
ncbi:hypothetical protein BGZ88_005516, partial [Linnemannia elongata]